MESRRPRVPGSPETRHAFLTQSLPAALAELEAATADLLDSGWEEARRRRACDLAEALAEAVSRHALKEVAGALRAAGSLLRLSAGEVRGLEEALREKFAELNGLLREMVEDLRERETA
ncbi:MAG TPA: hypothetical protein VNO22_02500 [Planctomycetota bacterium]|nr:hypothetical protein [Planctomycetota bacterium]